MNGTALLVDNLDCGYESSGRNVLSGVNLEIRRGRFLCIIGPNGAGKTTLLRTLAGLLPPLGGRVLLGGQELTAMHANERARRLSVVLTHLESPGYLSVERFVELGRHPYTGLLARLTATDIAAVDEALELANITALRARWMAEISDGERQRAAVARALAQAADVMILDEPTAFLDVAARASVMTTLRRIAHETDRLIVTTSHDVELVLRTADVLAIIDRDGRIHLGSPEDLVLAGALQTLFPDRSLRFDPESGSFRLPHASGSPVRLVGDGIVAQWTSHALDRVGRPVVQGRRGDGLPVVTITTTGDHPVWTIGVSDRTITVHTIEALAEVLRE